MAIYVVHNKRPLTVFGYDLTLFGLNFLHVNKRDRVGKDLQFNY